MLPYIAYMDTMGYVLLHSIRLPSSMPFFLGLSGSPTDINGTIITTKAYGVSHGPGACAAMGLHQECHWAVALSDPSFCFFLTITIGLLYVIIESFFRPSGDDV